MDAKTTRIVQLVAAALALLYSLGFLALLAVLVLRPIPPENSELLFAASGVLFGIVNFVAGYYWGSSAGSKAKDATIAHIAETTPPGSNPDHERI
jgi:uncharacterized membrane protein YdjX (TVP38/TMEM64 family)